MGLLLFRFWPALLPLLIYVVWYLLVRRRAVAEGSDLPLFRDGPWYWIIITTLLVAAGCFIALGTVTVETKGKYVPTQIRDGYIIPAHINENK